MLIAFVRRHERHLIAFGLLAVSLVVGIDIYEDIRDGLPFSHLIHELLILGFCLLLTLFQMRVIAEQRDKLHENSAALNALANSRDEFRRLSLRFSDEFARAVHLQFSNWQLTESERDVALLLIKGFSMKEIAETRSSKESTVRQQASSIYRKSNLAGRQDLAAYFLEDLFSPLPPANPSASKV